MAFRITLWFIVFSLIPVSAFSTEQEAILLGAHVSLTGPLVPDSEEQAWAYEQAVLDINAGGGIFVKAYGKKLPVKLIIEDDASDPLTAALVTEKLITQHKVDIVISHNTSLVIPSCVVAEKLQKYYHANTCFVPPWQAKKFQWSTLLFTDPSQSCNVPFQIWDSLPVGDRPRRPALLVEDNPGGAAFGKEFRKIAKEKGYSFTVDEPLAVGGDYSRQLLNLKGQKVDAVLIFGGPKDCIPFVRQMKALELNVKYMHGWRGLWPWKFWQELGKDAQYMISDGFWSEDYPYPGAERLGHKFFQRFNRKSVSVGLPYACCQILWAAIEAAGSLDSAAIRKAVLQTPFTATVVGDVKYSGEGIAYIPSTAHQWWDGQQKWIYPFGQGAWKIKLMPPWNERK